MKFIIDQSALTRAMKHVLGVVPRRNTIPVINNVLLTADGTELKICATDCDMEMSERIDAQIDDFGAITVPAQTLYDIVRELPSGSEIGFEDANNGNRIKLHCGSARFELATLPAADFPKLGGDAFTAKFNISSEDLLRMIAKTRFAISSETTRYYLCGLYLHKHYSGTLRAAACDSYRAAIYSSPLPAGAENLPGIIVPEKMVTEMYRITDDLKAAVEISACTNRISASVGRTILTSKLIDGDFPEYECIIPDVAKYTHTATVMTEAALKAINLVSVVLSGKTTVVRIDCTKSSIMLSAVTDTGEVATKDVNAEIDGREITFGADANYLRDTLSAIGSRSVKILTMDPQSPIRVIDTEDNNAIHVIMPMKV